MWILTGGDDQVHLWWQVINQKGKCFFNRFGIDLMVIVQDKDEIVRDSCNLIEQVCKQSFSGRRLMGIGEQLISLLQSSE